MGERQNRFLTQYKQRNKTATDDFVDQLYEEAPESSKEPVIPESIHEEELPPTFEETSINPPLKEKKKVGRPRKTDEERSIFNIKLSVSEKEMLTVASAASGKTRVDYIVDLLKADYANNKEYYDTVRKNIYKK